MILRRVHPVLSAIVCCLLCVASARAATSATPARRSSILQLLNDGNLNEAILTLRTIVAAAPTDGDAQLLLCRAYFAEAQSDLAIAACEAATQSLPSSAEAQDWLGRAYGRKADHASPLAGFQLARKVRDAFEAAVHLDPASPDAVGDLGEYYVGAPQVVGGGLDRADDLARRTQTTLPVQSHRIFAMAAEKRRDFSTAEREYAAAIGATRTPLARAGALVDLALYYQHRRDADNAIATVRRCLAADPSHSSPSVDAASILVELKREPELARHTLEQYLVSANRSDASPVVNAYLLLSRLQLAEGDRAGAKIELSKALELAPAFEPARQALQGL